MHDFIQKQTSTLGKGYSSKDCQLFYVMLIIKEESVTICHQENGREKMNNFIFT